MHEINRLFDEVKNRLWNIKEYNELIDFKDLVDFYKEYEFCANLAVDALNAQVIQYDGFDMPFSEKDISYMIEAFITFNQYNYNRLMVDTLIVLNHLQAWQYLSKILDTTENRKAFAADFHNRVSHFEQAKEELLRLGVKMEGST